MKKIRKIHQIKQLPLNENKSQLYEEIKKYLNNEPTNYIFTCSKDVLKIILKNENKKN